MDIKQFQTLLAGQERYETVGALKTVGCGHTFRFYLKQFSIVRRSSRLAKRGRYAREAWAEASFATLMNAEQCGGRFCISGLRHLQKLRYPVVFVANHMSTLENFVLPTLLLPFTDITFVIKRSLTTYPLFGHVMRATNPIVVNRVNPREDLKTVLTEGSAWIQRQCSIVVYPQATRVNVLDVTKFNSIGLKLAERTKVPIVPIALKTDFWANGKLHKDFGRIHPERRIYMEFGPPLYPGKERSHDEIVDFICSRLAQWA